MKSALQKSPIPNNHAFIVQELTQPKFDPVWHFHPEFQIFMVISGSGTRFIGDNIKSYKSGEITLIGPNLPHLWRSDKEAGSPRHNHWSKGIVVYFHEHLIGDDLLVKEELIKVRHILKESRRGINIYGETGKKVGMSLRKLNSLEGFEAMLEILKILDLVSKSDELETLASPGYTNTLKHGDTKRMHDAYNYVMKNFKSGISLEEVASLTNMSATSFSRYFKKHANKTFSEFVSEIRIGHACKLLIENKFNVSQACYASGFQTISNFNRQFKAITHRKPLDYKKEYMIKQ